MGDKLSKSEAFAAASAPLTLEQFNAFLAANAPEKPCDECGNTAWVMPGDKDQIFKGFMANEISFGSREFYPITCRHCGFAKLYAADVAEHWAETTGNG